MSRTRAKKMCGPVTILVTRKPVTESEIKPKKCILDARPHHAMHLLVPWNFDMSQRDVAIAVFREWQAKQK
jgi:hypothetical protein